MSKLYASMSLALVALLLGTLAYFVLFGGSEDQFADCRVTKIGLGKSSIGGPFTLVNKDGVTVTDKDVLSKPSLIYFGYTYCPDVCPADNARNAEAVDILTAKGIDVQSVFISIDPERDTPAVVGEYAGYFDEQMIGLTGSPEQVKVASKAYKTYFHKNGTGDDYLVDHTTFTYLTLPKFGFVELFRRDATPKVMANAVACFVGKS